MEKQWKLGMIGYGNMATAIVSAITKAKVLEASEMAIYEVNARAKKRASMDGLAVMDTIGELCRRSSMILLAVKPNKVPEALQEAGPALEGKALMSIAAGVSCKKLKEFSGSYFLRVLRIMPNTAAMAGEGAMVLCSNTNFTESEKQEAEQLMAAVGRVEWMEERHMDAVTGLSGSGPAYVAMFIEALADGGVMEGLPRLQAMNLAMQTVLGTAKLLQEKGMHPGQMKDMVCSPGGTAIEGVKALEEGGFRHTVMDAVIRASEKSRRLI